MVMQLRIGWKDLIVSFKMFHGQVAKIFKEMGFCIFYTESILPIFTRASYTVTRAIKAFFP